MFLESRFLAEHTELDRKGLQEDTQALGECSADQLTAIREFLSEGRNLLKRDQVLGDRILALCTSSGIGPSTFAAARRLAGFCMRAQLEHEEDIDTMVAGLETVGAFEELDEAKVLRLREFLTGLRDTLVRCARLHSRSQHLAMAMPSLDSVDFTTNLRAVLRRGFHPLRDEAASYEPEVVEYVPVGIVALGTDERDCEMSFQLDQRNLDKLLDSLVALKKELEEAAASLGKKGIAVPDIRTE